MPIEQIIEQIRSQHPEISEKEIAEKLKREKSRTGGFISDDTLLRMIAAELGMEMQSSDSATPTLSVVDLVPSLSDVTVVGRVVAVFSPKTFNGNRKGKLASFIIADGTGIVRVVTWNDRTKLVESGDVKIAQILRVSHAYTKEGRGGKVELHVGEKSTVEFNPVGFEPRDYPAISRFATNINEITLDKKNRTVNVVGHVDKLLPASAFEREDSSPGKVMRFTLADKTGEIIVVVWNEKVDELQTVLKEHARLQIVNARVKKTVGQKPEIHVGSETYVGAFTPDEEFIKMSDLKEGLVDVNVEGQVVTKPLLRDVRTFKQEIVRLATFELKDDTGKIWVSAWGRHASVADDLKVGDRIILKKAYVRRGFGDQLEISTRDTTVLTAIH
jgi:ssDNA-binding replication factor A large subunit